MSTQWIGLLAGIVILAAAIPYVRRIRHPAQKPLAAYLIFLFTFAAAAVPIFGLLAWLASRLGFEPFLGNMGPAILFLALVFVPAIALATWQARKPPWQKGPPD
ncbi:MAG: hypothetical protein PVG38_03460 [Gammaproteobacteria bacterium]|jgi:hypothetical protein